MFERVLQRMRALVRQGRYVLTVHAEEEMEADGLSILDVERCVLSGSIVERQRDRLSGAWKYVIRGDTTAITRAGVVARISPVQKVVVLTVYAI